MTSSKQQEGQVEANAGSHSTIYLACPARAQTGGPEAIHQLASTLRELGHDARIVYMSENDFNTVEEHPDVIAASCIAVHDIPDKKPAAYDIYDTVAATEIYDRPENVLIFPEAKPGLFRLGTRIRKCMWWLSVDNAARGIRQMGGIDVLRSKDIVHLAQSAYAENFLGSHGFEPVYGLYDYTSPVFFNDQGARERVNRVLFNPSKGLDFVRELVKLAPDLPWTPITGMSPQQVRDLLQTSKLYIDFGHHPGKDRIPREAAISGCCVITNRRGAAGYFRDVPIPAQYKFDDSPQEIPRVVEMIRHILAHYEDHRDSFSYWRRCIRTEREEFKTQAKRVFG